MGSLYYGEMLVKIIFYESMAEGLFLFFFEIT